MYEEKGMGSVNGGEWQPKKEEDKRFLGEPGEIKTTEIKTGKGPYQVETKIGKNGKAESERHLTDNSKPHQHTNPHDHKIDWSGGKPQFGDKINYPNGAPEFKNLKGVLLMSHNVDEEYFEQLKFKTISDFKWCMECGGEVQFEWKGKEFCAFGRIRKTEISPIQILIGPNSFTEEKYPGLYKDMWCDSIDDALEYNVEGDTLRNVITEVKIIERTV